MSATRIPVRAGRIAGRPSRRRQDPSDARGIALVVVLLVMGLLTLLGATFLTMSSTEHTVASNEAGVAKAFNIAEAGLERAKERIKTGTEASLDAFLPGGTPGPNLYTDVPFSDGKYSVVIEDDADEPSFSPNNPSDDKNGRVFIRSTGSFGTARKQILALARVVKGPMVPAPRGAAEAFATNGSTALHAAHGYFDGRDWTAPVDISRCTSDINACGTKISDAGTYGRFSNLDAASFEIDGGRSYGTGCLVDACAGTEKTASQQKDATVPAARWDSFVTGMIPRANRALDAAALAERGTVTWGIAAAPEITVINASGSFDWVTVVNGAGVLIINESTTSGQISWYDRGALNWQGIVIINAPGKYRFDTGGTGKVRIFGQLVSRAATSAHIELHNDTSFVKYSSAAVKMVQQNLGGDFTVLSWQEVGLP